VTAASAVLPPGSAGEKLGASGWRKFFYQPRAAMPLAVL